MGYISDTSSIFLNDKQKYYDEYFIESRSKENLELYTKKLIDENAIIKILYGPAGHGKTSFINWILTEFIKD